MKKIWYNIAGITVMLGMLGVFSGCEKEITKEEIIASEVYQELDSKYTVLQRKYEKLKANTKNQNETEEMQAEVTDYLKKIKKSVFVKVKYSLYQEPTINKTVDNVSFCKWLKKQVGAAIELTNVNADEFTAEQEALYSCVLYNEDNSVCEYTVYPDNYVIFAEFPDSVFYVEGANRLGDAAFLRKGEEGIPKQSLFADMYDSPLVYAQEQLLTVEQGRQAASAIYQAKHKKLKETPLDVPETSKKQYTFYSFGKQYQVAVFDKYLSITTQTETIWYKIRVEDAQKLMEIAG